MNHRNESERKFESVSLVELIDSSSFNNEKNYEDDMKFNKKKK